MPEFKKIKVAESGDVTTITLSNPERRNAIGPQMTNEFLHALEAARASSSKVIVLTGEGKTFCAGGDFSQMTGDPDAEALPHKGGFPELLQAMANTDKPIVAKVNGHAMGGGLGLVASCTFAIAAEEASLGTPEIDVGLFPMMIMAVLSKIVPRRRLLSMMLLGEKMKAREALELGLVTDVVPLAELDAKVADLVTRLASKAPLAVKLGLRAHAEQDGLPLEKSLPILQAKLGELLATDDAREGLMAFLEKRTPTWTGK